MTHELSVKYPRNRITMYSYGSPRAGNGAFAEAYDRANGDSYRLVNEFDVIARFPRSRNASLFHYDHVGRTVLLDVTSAKGRTPVWIEGVDPGPCPLRDVAPLNPSSALRLVRITATSVGKKIEVLKCCCHPGTTLPRGRVGAAQLLLHWGRDLEPSGGKILPCAIHDTPSTPSHARHRTRVVAGGPFPSESQEYTHPSLSPCTFGPPTQVVYARRCSRSIVL
jgi:hypothetical protein